MAEETRSSPDIIMTPIHGEEEPSEEPCALFYADLSVVQDEEDGQDDDDAVSDDDSDDENFEVQCPHSRFEEFEFEHTMGCPAGKLGFPLGDKEVDFFISYPKTLLFTCNCFKDCTFGVWVGQAESDEIICEIINTPQIYSNLFYYWVQRSGCSSREVVRELLLSNELEKK